MSYPFQTLKKMNETSTRKHAGPVSEKTLLAKALESSLDYPAYRELVLKQVEEGRTSGLNQSEANVYYTLLNHKRMRRWDKKIILPGNLKESLKKQRDPLILLVLTETWCGDAAPVLPVVHAITSLSPALDFRIVMRDEHLLLMDRFLTNNARSIPKVLLIRPGDHEVIGSWGPRPVEAAKMAEAYKKEHGTLTDAFRESLQKWYNQDGGKSIIAELSVLLALE